MTRKQQSAKRTSDRPCRPKRRGQHRQAVLAEGIDQSLYFADWRHAAQTAQPKLGPSVNLVQHAVMGQCCTHDASIISTNVRLL